MSIRRNCRRAVRKSAGSPKTRAFLTQRLSGAEVKLSRVAYDKYGGRVRAAIADKDGDIARALLEAGFARVYRGERRQSWCEAN